jgi:glycosyltransferase involved in cell wall biosynthesis
MSFPTKVTVGTTFGIYPPRGGGQLRLFHICRHLATRCPVDVIALVAGDEAALERELAPGLREIRVPKSAPHVVAETELERQAGVPVTDVAFPELHELTPAFAQAVSASAAPDGALMACHPYTLPVLAAVHDQPRIWYDVQDVEADLKAKMLARSSAGSRLLTATRKVERACCERAELVMAVSSDDASRLRALYDVPDSKLALVPNGVDTGTIPFTDPAERHELSSRLLMHSPLALFIGSWHEPNLAAVRRIIELAPKLPDVTFAVVGSVCLPFEEIELPANVELMGIVGDELKDTLLTIAAVALNPMSEGSGTNIKMLDYLAAGVPVVSTQVGARGLQLDPERHVRIAAPREFGSAIRNILTEPRERAAARAQQARRHVEQNFDWEVVARQLLLAVEGLPDAAQPTPALSTISPVSRSR